MSTINNTSGINRASIIKDATDIQKTLTTRIAAGELEKTIKGFVLASSTKSFFRGEDLLVIQESRNITDGISLVQTAGIYEAVASKSLTRMKELASQAANGTYSGQQERIMQQEFDQLAAENARAAASAEFNGVKLHQGDVVKIHSGDTQVIEIHTEAVETVKGDLVNDAEGAMAAVDTAIKQTSAYRGRLGATAKRLGLAADVLSAKAENLMAAKSRISDADIAKSTAALAATNVRAKAAIAIHAQANSEASGVLALLRG